MTGRSAQAAQGARPDAPDAVVPDAVVPGVAVPGVAVPGLEPCVPPGGAAVPDAGEAAGQASRFGKARAVRSTVQAEDYVELIADLLEGEGEARTVEIARRQGVSHATVIKTMGRLRREGLVSGRPYRGLFLTEAGHALALRVRARHQVVMALLLALGVPAEDARADAEGIEHHVSEGTLAAFSRFLER